MPSATPSSHPIRSYPLRNARLAAIFSMLAAFTNGFRRATKAHVRFAAILLIMVVNGTDYGVSRVVTYLWRGIRNEMAIEMR